jgi:hypothetical protein
MPPSIGEHAPFEWCRGSTTCCPTFEIARQIKAGAHRTPVPLQRWHFTTLSPFLSKPFPSQFLQVCFFFMFGPFSLAIVFPNR